MRPKMRHELERPSSAVSLLTEDRGQGFGMKPAPGQEAGGWDGVGEGHHLLPSILPGDNCVSILSLIGENLQSPMRISSSLEEI